MHKNNCKPDYNIAIVYCGGWCVSQYREHNQPLELFESEYSANHMIVSGSDWTGYNDVVKSQEYNCYCMLPNGCFIIHQNQSILIKSMAISG